MNQIKIIILTSILSSVLTALIFNFFVINKNHNQSRNEIKIQTTIPQPVPAKNNSINPACVSESLKHCSQISGSNEIDACLHDNFNQIINQSCKYQLQATIDSWDLCKDDIVKFCPQAKFGGGRMAKCLESYKNKLSHLCLQRLNL